MELLNKFKSIKQKLNTDMLIDLEELNLAINELQEYISESIKWSINDFEIVAKELKGDKWEDFYDKNKFKEILHLMIKNHLQEVGVNKSTVHWYMENMCLIRDKL